MHQQMMVDTEVEMKVSFGYQCNGRKSDSYDISDGCEISPRINLQRTNSSFSCLSGAALSANATLANTNICNGLIGAEILPSLDSPTSFRRIPSSPSFSKFDVLSSSLQSSMSNLSCSPSTPSDTPEYGSFSLKSMSAPSRNEGFLNAMEVQVAGGAAGEDRVQAVCSEENGWVFCAIYDGFNGRDAADFLAGTLYETIRYHLNSLDWELDSIKGSCGSSPDAPIKYILEDGKIASRKVIPHSFNDAFMYKSSFDSPKHRVLDSLQRAISQAENDFLYMVEQEMDDRPDIVSVGSCVLVVLLHGKDLYILNLGDSRAVLATYGEGIDLSQSKGLQAMQLTESHTVDNESEKSQLLYDHPDDPATIVGGKVKGKLKVTRAFGVGYLKKV